MTLTMNNCLREHGLNTRQLNLFLPQEAGAADAKVRCIIRYSTLRAVPVFLPPACRAARRSPASHPVFHGLGDTKLPQTGFRTQRP